MMIFAFFNSGFAQQNRVNTFRINLSPEKLLLHEDGIFLKVGSFGNISLSNLQFDERGYYTTCCLTSACRHCYKQFENCPNTCDHCGSEELDVIEATKNHFPTIQFILHAALKSASLNEEIIPCGGKYGVKAKVYSKCIHSILLSKSAIEKRKNHH